MKLFSDIESFSEWISENTRFSTRQARMLIDCGLISGYRKDGGNYVLPDSYTVPEEKLSSYNMYSLQGLAKETGVDGSILVDAFHYFKPVRTSTDPTNHEKYYIYTEDEVKKLKNDAPALSERLHEQEIEQEIELVPEDLSFVSDYEESGIKDDSPENSVIKDKGTPNKPTPKKRKIRAKTHVKRAENISLFSDDVYNSVATYRYDGDKLIETAHNTLQSDYVRQNRVEPAFISESPYTENKVESIKTEYGSKNEYVSFSHQNREVVGVRIENGKNFVTRYGSDAVSEALNHESKPHNETRDNFIHHSNEYKTPVQNIIENTRINITHKEVLPKSDSDITKTHLYPEIESETHSGTYSEAYSDTRSDTHAESRFDVYTETRPKSYAENHTETDSSVFFVLDDGTKAPENAVKEFEEIIKSEKPEKESELKVNIDNKEVTTAIYSINNLANGTYMGVDKNGNNGAYDPRLANKPKYVENLKDDTKDLREMDMSGFVVTADDLSRSGSNKEVNGIRIKRHHQAKSPSNALGRMMTKSVNGADFVRGVMLMSRYTKAMNQGLSFMSYHEAMKLRKKSYKVEGKIKLNQSLKEAGVDTKFLHNAHGRLNRKLTEKDIKKAYMELDKVYQSLTLNTKVKLSTRDTKGLEKLLKEAKSRNAVKEIAAIESILSLREESDIITKAKHSGMRFSHSMSNLFLQITGEADFVRGGRLVTGYLRATKKSTKWLGKKTIKMSRKVGRVSLKTMRKLAKPVKPLDKKLTEISAKHTKNMALKADKKVSRAKVRANRRRTGIRGQTRKRLRNTKAGRMVRKYRVRKYRLGKTIPGKTLNKSTKMLGKSFGVLGKLFMLPAMMLKFAVLGLASILLICLIPAILCVVVIAAIDIFPGGDSTSTIDKTKTVIEFQTENLDELNEEWLNTIAELPAQLAGDCDEIVSKTYIYNEKEFYKIDHRILDDRGENFNPSTLGVGTEFQIYHNQKNVGYSNTKEIINAATQYLNEVGIDDEEESKRFCEQLFWHTHAINWTVQRYGNTAYVTLYVCIVGSEAVRKDDNPNECNYDEERFDWDYSIFGVDNELLKIYRKNFNKIPKKEKTETVTPTKAPKPTKKPKPQDDRNEDSEDPDAPRPSDAPFEPKIKDVKCTLPSDMKAHADIIYEGCKEVWKKCGILPSHAIAQATEECTLGRGGSLWKTHHNLFGMRTSSGYISFLNEKEGAIRYCTNILTSGYYPGAAFQTDHIEYLKCVLGTEETGPIYCEHEIYTEKEGTVVCKNGVTATNKYAKEWLGFISQYGLEHYDYLLSKELEIDFDDYHPIASGYAGAFGGTASYPDEDFDDEYDKKWKGYDRKDAEDLYHVAMEEPYHDWYGLREPDKYFDIVGKIDEVTGTYAPATNSTFKTIGGWIYPTSGGNLTIPILYQGDYSHYHLQGEKTIQTSGCGFTSMAMILSALSGNKVAPDEMCSHLKQGSGTKYYAYNQGMYSNGGEGIFNDLKSYYGIKGFKAVHISHDSEGAKLFSKYAQMHYPIIVLTGGHNADRFTYGGHYIVVRGAEKGQDGQVRYYVNDPNGRSNGTRHGMTPEQWNAHGWTFHEVWDEMKDDGHYAFIPIDGSSMVAEPTEKPTKKPGKE